MRLESGTRSILAYFRDEAGAAQAAQTLTQLGFQDIAVDTIVPVPGRAVYSGPATSLTAMVLGAGSGQRGDSQVLLGADPDVSGMAGRSGEGPGYTHLLAMAVDSGRADIAVRVLKSCGALV